VAWESKRSGRRINCRKAHIKNFPYLNTLGIFLVSCSSEETASTRHRRELDCFAVAGLSSFPTQSPAHTVLITIAVDRFRRRRNPPPETFVFVGVGIGSGAIGLILNAAIALNQVAPAWDVLGRRLLTEGMVLMLVLGIGGFLGPRLLGFVALPNFQKIDPVLPQERPPFVVRNGSRIYLVAAGGLLISLVGEYGFSLSWMAFLRATIASTTIFSTLQPWKRPAVRTTLAWCVWVAHWLLVIGMWLVAIAPRYRVDFLHVIFMGGFTLLILAVGTRVALSHGGHPLRLEQRSWPLRIGITTGLIAMLARVGAPFAPSSFFEHLALAAILWIAGILVWGFYLLRLIRTRSAAIL
jgi:uncharacterized protein involved in response to NO